MRPIFSTLTRARAYYSRKNRLGQDIASRFEFSYENSNTAMGFDKVVVSGRKNGWETAFHFS